MTETKQTPKQFVTTRIESATSRKRGDDGLIEIVDRDFRRIGNPTTTANGAWKQAADHLALLDAKQKQADDFNAQARKPVTLVKVDEAQTTHGLAYAPKRSQPYTQTPITTISHKEKAKRRAKGKMARQARKIQRRKAA